MLTSLLCFNLIENRLVSRYSLPTEIYHPPIAQSVEREAYTFVVLGSSPSWRT